MLVPPRVVRGKSDAYKLLFQEIYATQPIRLTRVVVGSGAIAMQSMVLLLVFWTLHGKMVAAVRKQISRRDVSRWRGPAVFLPVDLHAGLLASFARRPPRARVHGPLRGIRGDDH